MDVSMGETAAKRRKSARKGAAGRLIVETWPIARLAEYAQNPRKNDHAVEQMVRVIREYGFRIPVVARSTGELVDGHLRLKAARKMGLTEVPVALADDLTPAQIKAFRLLANRSATWAEWDDALLSIELTDLGRLDFDLSLTGFNSREIDRYMKGDGQGDPDEVPEVEATAVSVPGDVWILGKHRVICGDSTDDATLKAVMGGRMADCVFTSPPYGVNLDYGASYQDTIANLRAMIPRMAAAWARCVVAGGCAIINFVDIVAGAEAAGSDEVCEYPMVLEYWPAFRGAGWVLYTRRVWAKPHAKVSAPWTANSSRAACDWEHLYVWKRPGKPLLSRSDNSAFGVWDSTDREGLGDNPDYHNAVMPVAIPTLALETHSRRGKPVLEPFCGTGTTIIAAENTDRLCRAVELNPFYVDVAVRRWQRFSGHDAVHEATGETFAKRSANA